MRRLNTVLDLLCCSVLACVYFKMCNCQSSKPWFHLHLVPSGKVVTDVVNGMALRIQDLISFANQHRPKVIPFPRGKGTAALKLQQECCRKSHANRRQTERRVSPGFEHHNTCGQSCFGRVTAWPTRSSCLPRFHLLKTRVEASKTTNVGFWAKTSDIKGGKAARCWIRQAELVLMRSANLWIQRLARVVWSE